MNNRNRLSVLYYIRFNMQHRNYEKFQVGDKNSGQLGYRKHKHFLAWPPQTRRPIIELKIYFKLQQSTLFTTTNNIIHFSSAYFT